MNKQHSSFENDDKNHKKERKRNKYAPFLCEEGFRYQQQRVERSWEKTEDKVNKVGAEEKKKYEKEEDNSEAKEDDAENKSENEWKWRVYQY